MRTLNKWAALAVAHLIVLTFITVGVIVIAVRLGNAPRTAKDGTNIYPGAAPSEAEANRLKLLAERIDVMQDNLSNADTVGFKRERVDVEEGPPPRISAVRLDLTQGSLQATGGNLDVAIQGDGFLRVKTDPAVGDGTGYTRNGTLFLDKNNQLIAAAGDGHRLTPPITLPTGATHVQIAQDGTVGYVSSAGGVAQQVAGRLQLYHFANPSALMKVNGLLVETDASGPAMQCNAGDPGVGVIQQGFLESSNVDAVKEWAALLRAQQMLQFSKQAVQLGDAARQATAMTTLPANALARN